VRRADSGFTLIEVLIALAIIAIGLSAALRASALGTDGVGEYRQRLLSGWLAENIAAERSARSDWPAPGESHSQQAMAGETFEVREVVKTTPNPRFRRLDIEVAGVGEPGHVLRHLSIFLIAP
jgi:general secretion pathway protein I